MTRTTRNRLLVIGLLLAVIVLIVVFTLFDSEEDATPADEPLVVETEGDLGISSDIPAAVIPSGLEPDPEPVVEGRTASLQIAQLFAERYGSYSNQGGYRNLQDLLPVMTASYRLETEELLEEVASNPPAIDYEGFTATRVSQEEISFNENAGTAVYEISLQQVKTTSTGSEILYRTLRVELRKVGDDWKVDDAEWVS